MLKLGKIKDIDRIQCDEIWCIVRNMKGGLPVSDVPIYHVPELAPSQELYEQYLNWQKAGEWNEEKFQKDYTPAFIREMKKEPARSKLMELAQKSKDKDILIACFCDDQHKCHRSLVKKFIDTQNMMYCLVAGTRTFDSPAFMEIVLDALLSGYGKNVVIVSGGARGADNISEAYADAKGLNKKIIPANWDVYGKRAGFIRNEQMHKYIAEKKRMCICFWDGESKGTAHNFKLSADGNTPLKKICYKKDDLDTLSLLKLRESAESARKCFKKYTHPDRALSDEEWQSYIDEMDAIRNIQSKNKTVIDTMGIICQDYLDKTEVIDKRTHSKQQA